MNLLKSYIYLTLYIILILGFFLYCFLLHPAIFQVVSRKPTEEQYLRQVMVEFKKNQKQKEVTPKVSSSSPTLPQEYTQILLENQNILFLLEPHLLLRKLFPNPADDPNLLDFIWRYNLPADYLYRSNSLTVGALASQFVLRKLNLNSFKLVKKITGPDSPFETNQSDQIQHLFYRQDLGSQILHLHVIILFPVKSFFWIAKIPDPDYFSLTSNLTFNPKTSFNIHYGRHEQIFDTADLDSASNQITAPGELQHFLGQLPTSRYLHCPAERSNIWFQTYNITQSKLRITKTVNSIKSMKSLMKELQMEFWIACGTLLGWYRQCTVTPYTTDTDFATWSKYISTDPNLIQNFRSLAPKYQLHLALRYGEPTETLELSLISKVANILEKVDLFWTYQNASHFLQVLHSPANRRFWHQWYPKYSLCSAELLGYKVLVPCDPETIIITEYGSKYQVPISKWNYLKMPLNVGSRIDFNFNVTQMESFPIGSRES